MRWRELEKQEMGQKNAREAEKSRTVTKCRVLTKGGWALRREQAQYWDAIEGFRPNIFVSTQEQCEGSDGCVNKEDYEKRADSSSILVQHTNRFMYAQSLIIFFQIVMAINKVKVQFTQIFPAISITNEHSKNS